MSNHDHRKKVSTPLPPREGQGGGSFLELLAPARTADIGIEAIRHGADAVYIGAPRFGARQAAGNSVEDIERLVVFAHQFDAKVYVTVNTILYDNELADVERMIGELTRVGVDALIVQDLAIHEMAAQQRIHIPLHASTQMDNRTPEQVAALYSEGYEQVVLARELSLEEIRDIHAACPQVKLEVFVHGALCVSLSGRCYASEAVFGRSANRGECAQLCRMAYDLEDEQGNVYVRNKHLLSLKDLCQIDALEELAEAGATSFKIEGRLKDMSYVKNVTAAYSQALDALCQKYPDRYSRSSRGRVEWAFQPDVRKSFNRGFTHYFLYGRKADIFSFDTPKALGEPVGRIREIYTDSIVMDGTATFANGDGLCFFDRKNQLIGMRVNRAEGARLFPLDYVHNQTSRLLHRGMTLYRNHDKHFEDVLAGKSAERFLPVDITLNGDGHRFQMTMTDGLHTVSLEKTFDAELARTHQAENIERQFSRLGNTSYRLQQFTLLCKKNWFIPSSVLGEWRRELVEKMKNAFFTLHSSLSHSSFFILHSSFPYSLNVSNASARQFYLDRGVEQVEPAFELQHRQDVPVMFCRHCLRYAMGWCYRYPDAPRAANEQGLPPRLFLRLGNGLRFELNFDCAHCQMLVKL